MWHQGFRSRPASGEHDARTPGSAPGSACRRAYYRVAGILPIRLTPLVGREIDVAIFDLSLPDPLMQPIEEDDENAPLMARLRRLEEKLDLLLGATRIDLPRPLSGRDRQSLVFSGSGLALEVDWSFRRGDAYRVEILLPAPYSRVVRAVGFAVEDPPAGTMDAPTRRLAIELRHMETADRDDLVAYSYDLQRVALRARAGEAGC
ncbi:MAG TPA: hypothetical protein ENI85_15385 [Deltaproteobacteria bacterium]|nr:hypothetical protein [Deltaproteobacteria bacterium]